MNKCALVNKATCKYKFDDKVFEFKSNIVKACLIFDNNCCNYYCNCNCNCNCCKFYCNMCNICNCFFYNCCKERFYKVIN